MWETISEFFNGSEFWTILLKVLVTTFLTTGIGFIGTLIGKAIAKNKESKIYKYAATCVRAAEMKYPNEGTKMGPQKMAYVMDQLAIKFPKIKENTYFYNIAEAAVLELNREFATQAAVKEFEEKYGETPILADKVETEVPSTEVDVDADDEVAASTTEQPKTVEVLKKSKLRSF